MGVTLADLTGDGVLDAYLSDLGENDLLQGVPGSSYVGAVESGANRIRPSGADPGAISSSWASGVADLNLDGLLDLVTVNGGFPGERVANKVAGTTIVKEDAPAIFLGLGNGQYADVWNRLGLEWRGVGRGLALGDLDADGDVDLVVTTRDEGLVVLRNDVSTPGLAISFEPACDLAGVEVTVETGAGSYHSLAAPHSFLGRHAPGVIVGGELLELRLITPAGRSKFEPPLSGNDLLVSCDDLHLTTFSGSTP